MDAEYQKHFKWCTENGIRIYPVPISSGKTDNYNIVVETKGKASKGAKVFNDKTSSETVEKVVGKRKIKEVVKIPSVWEQIRTLYKMIYEKDHDIK